MIALEKKCVNLQKKMADNKQLVKCLINTKTFISKHQ